MSKEKIQELDWEDIHIFINKPVYDKNIKWKKSISSKIQSKNRKRALWK